MQQRSATYQDADGVTWRQRYRFYNPPPADTQVGGVPGWVPDGNPVRVNDPRFKQREALDDLHDTNPDVRAAAERDQQALRITSIVGLSLVAAIAFAVVLLSILAAFA